MAFLLALRLFYLRSVFFYLRCGFFICVVGFFICVVGFFFFCFDPCGPPYLPQHFDDSVTDYRYSHTNHAVTIVVTNYVTF